MMADQTPEDRLMDGLNATQKAEVEAAGQAVQNAGASPLQPASQTDLFTTSDTSNSVNNLPESAQQQAAMAAMGAKDQMSKMGVEQGTAVDEAPHSFDSVGRVPLVNDISHPFEGSGSHSAGPLDNNDPEIE